MEPEDQKSNAQDNDQTFIIDHGSQTPETASKGPELKPEPKLNPPKPTTKSNPPEDNPELPKNYNPKDYYFETELDQKPQPPAPKRPFFEPRIRDTAPISPKPVAVPPLSGVYIDETQAKKLEESLPNSRNKKILLFGAVVLVLVIGISILLLSILKKPSLTKASIENNGYAYSFLYYGGSVQTKSESLNIITANAVSTIISPSPYKEDCHSKYSTLAVVLKVDVQNNQYSICSTNSGKTLVSSFKYSGVWQQAIITSANGVVKVDPGFAKQLISSISVF